VQDIFEVIALDRLFGVEQIQEFLYKLWCYVYFERSNFNILANDEL